MTNRASLNHYFRSVWNAALGAMVAVAEIGSQAGKSGGKAGRVTATQGAKPPIHANIDLLALCVAAAWAWVPLQSIANPSGAVAVQGQASLLNNGNSLIVKTQNATGTNYSAINWQSFSIPAGNSTYFQQPNAASTSINRVLSNNPSLIFGTLSSNGSLVLVNQSGITVGAGAVVDTAGFTASTLRMTDSDALLGRLRFGDGTASAAALSVQGSVLARSGDVVLLGGSVDTAGSALIQSPNGSTILAAGRQIEITGRGLEGIHFQVQAPSDTVLNLGTLKGDAVGIFAGTLKHSGSVQATAVETQGGKVWLKALDRLDLEGQVNARAQNGMGGVVHASADKVVIGSSAVVDASGVNGGGEILLGGGWQGEDARIGNASQTVVATGASIQADATVDGDGGTVVVWADGVTLYGGDISAKGGSQSGNGGQVEVSGKQYLDFRGAVDLRAAKGKAGSLLLDPLNLTIQADNPNIAGNSPGIDIVSATDFSYGSFDGVNSIITSGALANLLLNNDVSLTATNDISVTAPITKSSGGTVTSLTLDAGNNITVAAGAAIGTTDAPLSLSLNAGNNISVLAGITTNGGSVSMTAANTGAISTVGITTLGGDGTSNTAGSSGGAVTLTTNDGAITVGSIDTRGGAAGAGVDFTSGKFGGSGGAVSITRTTGALTLSGLSINSSGGAGGIGTVGGYGGGAGGAAGAITIAASAGTLTLDSTGTLTSLGGNGGDNSAPSYSGGDGGSGGALTLSGLGAGSALALNSQTVSNAGGTAGSGSGSAGYVGGSGAVNLNAGSGGYSQTGGTLNLGNVTLTSTGNVALGNMTARSLTVTRPDGSPSSNINITQAADTALTLESNADFTTGSGNITLENAGNKLSSIGVTSAGVVSLRDGSSGAGYTVKVNGVTAGSFELEAAGDVTFGSGNLTTSSGSVGINTTGGKIDLSSESFFSNISSVAGIKLQAKGDLNLGTAILTAGTGTDVVLVSTEGLLIAGAGGVDGTVTGAGRWLTYLASPLGKLVNGQLVSHNMGPYAGTAVGFRQYGKAFGDSTALGQATGNGNIYSVAASANPFTANISGTVSKTYDGLKAVTLSGVALASVAGSFLDTGDVFDTAGTAVNGVGTMGPHAGSNLNVVATAQALSGVVRVVGSTYSYPVYGYTVTASGNVGTVNAKTLSSTATITSVAKTYDGLLQAFGSSIAGSTSGALNGDTVALDTSGMFLDHSTAHAGATTINARGSAAVGTVAGGGVGNKDGTAENAVAGQAGDYTLTQPTFTNPGVAGTITPKALSSAATITPVDKTYDGMRAASTSTIAGTVAGALNGDTVALNTSGMFLDYNTAHAGVSATTISASGTAALGTFISGGVGAKNGNADNAVAGLVSDYVLTQPTVTNQGVTGFILAKQLSASASIGGATSKVYDGTLAAVGATVAGSTSGAIGSDVVALDTSGMVLRYSDSHVVTAGNTIGATGSLATGAVSSSGSGSKDGSNSNNLVVSLPGDYVLSTQPITISSVAATIVPRPFVVSAAIGGTLSKAYDGTTTATGAAITGTVGNAVSGDVLVLDLSNATLAYNSKDVATANAIESSGTVKVSITGSSVGSLISDYSLGVTTVAPVAASISPRALSNWISQTSGQWSLASNWDVMPSTGNVLAVSIPAGTTVTFDSSVAATTLQSINSLGTLSVTGSNLSVVNALNIANYSQSGGTVNGAGTFTASNSFSQSAGSIAMGGAVSIRQASGNLSVGSITGSSLALEAVGGSISQSAALATAGLLKVAANGGVTLTDAANSVSVFTASTTGQGDVALTNVGALDVQNVTVANGKLVIDNTGALQTSGAIKVGSGGMKITTHSPLTIGNTVNADGSIVLAALTPDGTSNIAINGAMTSTTGGISVQAYNNFIQNAGLSAALAIDVAAGGSVTFGPSALSVGNPVSYAVNGAPYVPPWIAATVSGGANSFVAAFLDQFQTALDAQQVLTADDPLGLEQRRKEGVVVEGEVCKP